MLNCFVKHPKRLFKKLIKKVQMMDEFDILEVKVLTDEVLWGSLR
jgi:hypothetical protein